jgi:hypothetical protein
MRSQLVIIFPCNGDIIDISYTNERFHIITQNNIYLSASNHNQIYMYSAVEIYIYLVNDLVNADNIRFYKLVFERKVLTIHCT